VGQQPKANDVVIALTIKMLITQRAFLLKTQ
jgi:hypothetical protein